MAPLWFVLAAFASCAEAPAPEIPLQSIRVAAGPVGGIYFRLGTALAELLERREHELRISLTSGLSVENLRALNDGAVDVVFTRADVAYAAYSSEVERQTEHGHRAIAVIHRSVLHAVTRGDGRIGSLAELPGARLTYGVRVPDLSSSARYVEVLGTGLDVSSTSLYGKSASFDDAVSAMASGEAEVSFVLTGFPLASLSSAARSVDIRLLEIDRETATRIRARYPFYKPTLIPSDTYPGQQEPIATVGVDNLIVCRATLDEDVVYKLTKAIFEWLPELAAANDTARQIHPELAPTAPIPLHAGAARYFRERELLR